jgi:threonine/homoserine/homoserine lactone efflux protein
MTLHTWWLFVATVFVVCAIPGPNMLLVMTHGAQHGLRRSSATMAGCLSALVLMLAVSAAGLGVLLASWPAMFNALRMIGAVYLVYLGIKAWRAPVSEAAADHADELAAKPERSRFALYRNGFLVGASNPKAILFATALLPQFIDAAQPRLPQFGAKLKSRSVARIFNRLTGGVFVGFGAMMALVRQ